MTEKKEFEIIKAKHWLKERGAFPVRIVLMKRFKQDGTIREYCTHVEVDDDGKQSFVSGRYFDTLANARRDYETRRA